MHNLPPRALFLRALLIVIAICIAIPLAAALAAILIPLVLAVLVLIGAACLAVFLWALARG